MKVLIRGDVNSPLGVSSMVRAATKGICNSVDLRIENRSRSQANIPVAPEFLEILKESCEREMAAPDVTLYMDTPETWGPHISGSKNVGWFRWGINQIHPAWVGPANGVDEIWVPGNMAKDALKKSGVDTPIKIVQTPVDNTIFGVVDGELPLSELVYNFRGVPIPRDDRKFTIGLIAHHNVSKGLEETLTALITDPNAGAYHVVLKTWIKDPTLAEEAQVTKMLNDIRAKVRCNGPKFTVLTRMLSDEEMAQLYNSLDLVLSLSRGDSSPLVALQALASGVPVLSTDWAKSPHLACNHTHIVPSYSVPAYGMGDAVLPTSYWGQFDYPAFRKTLLELWQKAPRKDMDRTKRKAEARSWILKNCGTVATGKQIIERLEELLKSAVPAEA